MAVKSQPTPGLLRQALIIAERIRKLEGELAGLLGQLPGVGSATAGGAAAIRGRVRRKPRFSAAARARISAAQSARWAKIRKAAKGKGNSSGAAAKKRSKPRFSAEARERIASAQRARRAKARGAKQA